MRVVFTIIGMCISAVFEEVYSQNALPNPGFENWTTTGTYENPDGWTTANSYSSLLGIELTTKATASSDVHSGSFALKTETIFIRCTCKSGCAGFGYNRKPSDNYPND
jgi:hypothetical protein